MMDPERHPAEELQLLLDGRLLSEQRTAVEEHLARCPSCQRELDALRRVKGALRNDLPARPVPSDVAARVSAALAAESGDARVTRRSPAARLWRRGTVAGLSVGAAAAVLLFVVARSARPDPVEAAAQDFASYRGATLSFQLETAEPPTLERFFGRSPMPFSARVYDFGMMGFRLAGGKVHRLAGRQSALFAYVNPNGQRVVCQMYQGRLSDLPPGAEEREHDGIRFRIYRTAGSTLVFWQEGSVVCVLATDGDPEAAVQLAFAKAIKT
jgi:anti-sigma factor RsiW